MSTSEVLLWKSFKGDDQFVVRDHLWFCYHSSEFDNIYILASSNNDFKIIFIETPLNSREHFPFGKDKQPLSLEVSGD